MTGWLPVRHHTNKITTTQQMCPLCATDETIAHLFQCPHRKVWQQQFLQQVQQQLKKIHMHQGMVTEIHQIFHQKFNHPTEYSHFSDFLPFAGLLPHQWNIHSTNTTVTSQGNTNRIKTLGRWFIQQGHELWLQRNKQIYDKDKKASTKDIILDQKIQQLYSLQEQIGYHDRDLFSLPLEDRLQLNHHQKMTWITHTSRTMKVSMEEFNRKQTSGQKDIRTFFKPRTNLI